MRRPLLLVLATLPGMAHADLWFHPSPRMFTDVGQRGNYGFKLLPQGSPDHCIGELFRMTPTGATPVIWRARLRGCPLEVYVDSAGAVVTLDNYGPELYSARYLQAQARHALVIYSPTGRVLADLGFADVMPGKPDADRFGRATPGLFLTSAFDVSFGSSFFRLVGNRGGKDGPSYDLLTGRRQR